MITLLLGPCIVQMFGGVGSSSLLVRAQDDADIAEGEEDADVSDETVLGEDSIQEETDASPTDAAKTEDKADEDEEAGEALLKPSPHATTTILFVKPIGGQDFPAGHEAKVLIGLSNKGGKDFLIETLDASLRYPQDFSYYIQNFTTYRLYQTVEPGKEVTFEYRFVPSEALSSRPFGLVINVNYKDSELSYLDAVFNSTINVVEPDEGFDGETFFMYAFLLAVVVLNIFGAYQFFGSIRKKHLGSKPKQVTELGTQNKGDIDYDWLPKEALQELNKSPKLSPKSKVSPRQRNSRRRAEVAED